MPQKKQPKRRKMHFGSWFQRFKFIVDWIHCFGLEVRQNTMVNRVRKRKVAHLMVARKQRERQKQRNRGRGRDKNGDREMGRGKI
jgi:hypothetical protein